MTPASPRVWNKRDPNVPKDAVYVGRPSQWGNPFKITKDRTREQVVADYRYEIVQKNGGIVGFNVFWVRRHLRGKHLVCWCAPLPCHADVLLELANA